ncbi:MAG: hypothetical protein AAF714_00420 [Pseudomonadota bacterium]
MLRLWLAQIALAIGTKMIGTILQLLLLLWVLTAAWFFFFGNHPPHHGLETRLVISAFVQAPSALPSLISWAIALMADMLSWGHAEVARDLGYSPFKVLGFAGISIEGFLTNVLALTLKAAALQAIGLTVMSLFGMRHDYPSPGTIVFFAVFDQWIYVSLIYGVSAWTVVSAFDAGLIHGFAGVVAGLIVVKFRVLSVLPLYILAGVREKFGTSFAEDVGPRSKGTGTGAERSYRHRKTGSHRRNSYRTGGRSGSHAHDKRRKHQQKQNAGASGHSERTSSCGDSTRGAGHSLANSCRLFGLKPDSFDYATLKKAYRAFMKEHHPRHADDSDEMAKRGNQAFSSIRKHYGWA